MRSIRDLISRASKSRSPTPKEVEHRKRSDIKRRQLRAAWNIDGQSKKNRIKLNRAIVEKVRKTKTRNITTDPLTTEENLFLLRRMRSSALLDHLHPKRKRPGHWKRLRDRDHNLDDAIINLKGFSFLDDPKKTINDLRKICEVEAYAPAARINFHDTYCLDVAPFMLLAECWDDMMPIFHGGSMDLPMKKVLSTVGLQRELKLELPGVYEYSDVWAFPVRRRRAVGSSTSPTVLLDVQAREVAADDFCEALDQWLGRPEIGFQLTAKGRGNIKRLLGELLENAERHSDGDRKDGSWAVSGFLARRSRSKDDKHSGHDYLAHIGIINLGDSFSESLDRASEKTKRHLDEYIVGVRQHGCKLSDEALRTLVAIQDGITCVEAADSDNRGGYGLQDMLELVSFLGGASTPERRPRVTILSGNSCIMLKEPYIRGERKTGPNGRRVLWCNDENTGKKPPDGDHVFEIDPGIPGTVISIGFTLEPEYFQHIDAGNGAHNV